MKFYDKYIDNLKPQGKIVDIREGGGFGVRVTPGGVKTWFYIYRFEGKRRFLNLGHYPAVSLSDARIKYRNALKLVEAGKDPLALAGEEQEERRKAPTVADLVNEYIEKHAMNNKKSWAEDKRCLEKEVVPLWGTRKAKDITKRDVVLLLEGIVKRGSPVMANNTLEKVRKMFNFAVERDILEHTPCYGVKKPTKKEHKDRVLTATEIKTVWNTIETAGISGEIRRGLKLILVTAQRPGEVVGMHSSEIDGHWWTIPADRAKNGKAHRVYLTDMALDLIGSLTVTNDDTGEIKPKGYLFMMPHCDKPMECNAIAYAIRRNLAWKLTGEDGKDLFNEDGTPATKNRMLIDKFTPHDFRRTAATGMAALRFPDEVIDAVLNHVKKGVVAIYNRHGYDMEKKQALEAWERKLISITSGTEGAKVILMNRTTAG